MAHAAREARHERRAIPRFDGFDRDSYDFHCVNFAVRQRTSSGEARRTGVALPAFGGSIER